MKVRFLYVGDKTLNHREVGLFRVLNCENNFSKNKVLDYKEICSRKKKRISFSEENVNRVCLRRRESIINFYSISNKEFFNTYLNDINLFKNLFNLKRCNKDEEEINIILFDILNSENNENNSYKEKAKLFLDNLSLVSKEVDLNRILIVFNKESIFKKVMKKCSKLGECSLTLNNFNGDLKVIIHTLVDSILLKDNLGEKWIEYRSKIVGSHLTLGQAQNLNVSGEIIITILNNFSNIQNDTLFKLVLMNKEEINLNEIALIEDALNEYIPLNGSLIIKQLTNEFLINEVQFLLFSK